MIREEKETMQITDTESLHDWDDSMFKFVPRSVTDQSHYDDAEYYCFLCRHIVRNDARYEHLHDYHRWTTLTY